MKHTSFLFVSIAAAALAAVSACGGSSGNSDVGSSSGDTSDGGSDDAAGGDDGGDPYATPTVCTSGATWTHGDRGSSAMHPGRACITCHTQNGGPRMTIAGTVYPTAHEPDDCNGVSGGVKIVITGADGNVVTLSANSVGNFYSTTTIATPFHAKVVANGRERAMTAGQTSGDCNSCHTEKGSKDAPGRIMAP